VIRISGTKTCQLHGPTPKKLGVEVRRKEGEIDVKGIGDWNLDWGMQRIPQFNSKEIAKRHQRGEICGTATQKQLRGGGNM